jgi:hypothetical protein
MITIIVAAIVVFFGLLATAAIAGQTEDKFVDKDEN